MTFLFVCLFYCLTVHHYCLPLYCHLKISGHSLHLSLFFFFKSCMSHFLVIWIWYRDDPANLWPFFSFKCFLAERWAIICLLTLSTCGHPCNQVNSQTQNLSVISFPYSPLPDYSRFTFLLIPLALHIQWSFGLPVLLSSVKPTSLTADPSSSSLCLFSVCANTLELLSFTLSLHTYMLMIPPSLQLTPFSWIPD